MTRAAPYGSAAWRAWKHDHHWAGSGTALDPLGAGNTALIAALGVTPLAFYDVRRNLTRATGVSSLADVKGDGTYGPALVQATGASQPAWDGTTINFDGVSDYLISSSAMASLDLSTPLTIAAGVDVPNSSSRIVIGIGVASAGSPHWYIESTATVIKSVSDHETTGASSTAATGSGAVLLVMGTINVSGTAGITLEVPTTAKVTAGNHTAETAGPCFLVLGATTQGSANCALRFRYLIGWAGGYSTAQRDTLKTYHTTHHGTLA